MIRATHFALLLALVITWCAPDVARGGTEEFSTFDIDRQEEDDESLIDHVLTRSPRGWRAAWERAPSAFRTEQGCLTSGQWFIHSDLKVETALGDRARFGVVLRQTEDDIANYNFLDLTARLPTRAGTLGVAFRPFYEAVKKHGFILYPGKLTERETFRVGCIGAIGPEEMRGAVTAIAETLRELGIASGAPALLPASS